MSDLQFQEFLPDTIFQFLFDFMNTKFPEVEATEEFFVELSMIANNSYGSVRRALQLLDRCLTAELFTVEYAIRTVSLFRREDIRTGIESIEKRCNLCTRYHEIWE